MLIPRTKLLMSCLKISRTIHGMFLRLKIPSNGPPSVKISLQSEIEGMEIPPDYGEPIYFLLKENAAVVKGDWFWESIKMGYCANPIGANGYELNGSSANSGRTKSVDRKRKTPATLRRSPRTSRPRISALEESSSHSARNASFDNMSEDSCPPSPFPAVPFAPSQRQRVVQELCQTEQNYCKILGEFSLLLFFAFLHTEHCVNFGIVVTDSAASLQF